MASINEAVFEELVEKGESIVNDLGGSIRSLLKYSDIHFSLMKIAKQMSDQESTLLATSHIFQQMKLTLEDLRKRMENTEMKLKDIPKVCDLFIETERAYISPTPSALTPHFLDSNQQKQ